MRAGRGLATGSATHTIYKKTRDAHCMERTLSWRCAKGNSHERRASRVGVIVRILGEQRKQETPSILGHFRLYRKRKLPPWDNGTIIPFCVDPNIPGRTPRNTHVRPRQVASPPAAAQWQAQAMIVPATAATSKIKGERRARPQHLR
jgi:hypothetical protein